MAKEFENAFIQNLEGSVIKERSAEGANDKMAELLSRKEELEKTLEEMTSNVIIDPKAVKKIRKEIYALEKAIAAGSVEIPKEAEEATDKDAKEEEQEKIEQETKKISEKEDEEKIISEEEQIIEEKSRADKLKDEYNDALDALNKHRLKSIMDAKRNGDLIISKLAFDKELKLEEKMYGLREEYMAMGYSDPYTKKREELAKVEREAKEPMERKLREKARKFKKLEYELADMDKEEAEINEDLSSRDISSVKIEELNDDLDKLDEKREQKETELADVRRDLEPVKEERDRRDNVRSKLEKKHVSTLSAEGLANYRYQQSKVGKMNDNIEKATEKERENIKIRIEKNEHQIKVIKNELDKTPLSDIEKRLELIEKFDRAASMLETDKQSLSEIDRGVKPKEDERKQEVLEKHEKEEARKEEFEKETSNARAIAEEQAKIEGEMVLEHPIDEAMKSNDRERESNKTMQEIVEEKEEKQEIGVGMNIAGLDQIKEMDEETAKEYIEQDETLNKAADELERKQEEIEHKMER